MTDETKIKSACLAKYEVDGVTRSIYLHGSYDLRSHPLNYGIHNAEMVFAVAKDGCEIVWAFSTGWWLKKLRRNNERSSEGCGRVTWISPRVQYEGSEPAPDGLFYESGYLISGETFDAVVENPNELWPLLELKLTNLLAQQKAEADMERNLG